MKLKEIKQLIKNGAAVDITNYRAKQVLELGKNLEKVEISFGKYGMNGALFRDKNNKLYAIRTRNSNLFILC